MTARLEIEGIEKFTAELAKLGERAPTAAAAAIFEEAESIMAHSRPLVPVDTGTLRGSGIVDMPIVTGQGASVEFGYGGAASQYALVQHERMDYRHTSGQAKYLEQPTLEAAHGMGPRLAARLRRMFTR